jgi:hypothetical protein
MSATKNDFCHALAEFMAKHRRGAWIYVGSKINDRARHLRCQQWIRRQPEKARKELIAWADELGVLPSLRQYCPFDRAKPQIGEAGLRNMIVLIAIALATREGGWSVLRVCPRKELDFSGPMKLVIERRLDG